MNSHTKTHLFHSQRSNFTDCNYTDTLVCAFKKDEVSLIHQSHLNISNVQSQHRRNIPSVNIQSLTLTADEYFSSDRIL